MNIQILDSWLRQYLVTKAKPEVIQRLLTLSGPAVETITPFKDDFVYDIEITTNRIDTASVYGIAREAVTILKRNNIKAELKDLALDEVNNDNDHSIQVEIVDAKGLVNRAIAVAMSNVLVTESPQFIQDRLEAAGIRALNNLIDITNYVMLEVGHPVHVFDLDRIGTNKLVFRYAKENEPIITLDGKKHYLTVDDVVIDDGTGRVIDLPGIMGTKNSVVTNETKNILIFIESNDPYKIRRTSMRNAIRTTAASYNENKPDVRLAETALKRCVKLYKEIAKAVLASKCIDIGKPEVARRLVSVSIDDIRLYMNVEIKVQEVISILKDLGFMLENQENKNLVFNVPSYRMADVEISQDLIEEVARIYGYDKIPSIIPPLKYISDSYIRKANKLFGVENLIRRYIANIGFFELYNYSMVSKEEGDKYSFIKNPIEMINPMSRDLVCFRQSLIPSLVKNINQNKSVSDIKIFEIANVYLPTEVDLPQEKKKLTLLARVDYFEMKGVVESVLKFAKVKEIKFLPASSDFFLDPTLSVDIFLNKELIGQLGLLNSKILYENNLEGNYAVAELDISLLGENFSYLEKLKARKKIPAVIEDITYQFNGTNWWQIIENSLLSRFKEITKVEHIDTYKNNITLRVYSYPQIGKSILKDIISHLENKLKTKVIKN